MPGSEFFSLLKGSCQSQSKGVKGLILTWCINSINAKLWYNILIFSFNVIKIASSMSGEGKILCLLEKSGTVQRMAVIDSCPSALTISSEKNSAFNPFCTAINWRKLDKVQKVLTKKGLLSKFWNCKKMFSLNHPLLNFPGKCFL